jgi:uncharacterized protein YicC (UPF0701 family)
VPQEPFEGIPQGVEENGGSIFSKVCDVFWNIAENIIKQTPDAELLASLRERVGKKTVQVLPEHVSLLKKEVNDLEEEKNTLLEQEREASHPFIERYIDPPS